MNPSCPKCGKSMMRRLARRGPNAGNYFWGCSGYPDCRGIRNIDNNEILDEVNLNPIQSEENVSFDSDEISCGENAEICVSYEAKPYAGFDEMTSFQSTGCSRSIMEKINNDETFASAMLDTSKFRVDYTRAAFNELTEQQREICALLLRTLCRGRVTYISPFDRPSASRHDYGYVYKVGEKYYIDLNIQVRFKSIKSANEIYSAKWNEKADKVREHARLIYNGEEINL